MGMDGWLKNYFPNSKILKYFLSKDFSNSNEVCICWGLVSGVN